MLRAQVHYHQLERKPFRGRSLTLLRLWLLFKLATNRLRSSATLSLARRGGWTWRLWALAVRQEASVRRQRREELISALDGHLRANSHIAALPDVEELVAGTTAGLQRAITLALALLTSLLRLLLRRRALSFHTFAVAGKNEYGVTTVIRPARVYIVRSSRYNPRITANQGLILCSTRSLSGRKKAVCQIPRTGPGRLNTRRIRQSREYESKKNEAQPIRGAAQQPASPTENH